MREKSDNNCNNSCADCGDWNSEHLLSQDCSKQLRRETLQELTSKTANNANASHFSFAASTSLQQASNDSSLNSLSKIAPKNKSTTTKTEQKVRLAMQADPCFARAKPRCKFKLQKLAAKQLATDSMFEARSLQTSASWHGSKPRARVAISKSKVTSNNHDTKQHQANRNTNANTKASAHRANHPKTQLGMATSEQQVASRRDATSTIHATASANCGLRRALVVCALVACLSLWSLADASASYSRALVKRQAQQYFEVQPDARYLVAAGSKLRVRCIVRQLQGECLWLRNGKAIGNIKAKYEFRRQPEDGDCSLQLTNVSVASDGAWQCQVTAPLAEQETLQSQVSQLIVLLEPERPQIKNLVSLSLELHPIQLAAFWLCCSRADKQSRKLELSANKSCAIQRGKKLNFVKLFFGLALICEKVFRANTQCCLQRRAKKAIFA